MAAVGEVRAVPSAGDGERARRPGGGTGGRRNSTRSWHCSTQRPTWPSGCPGPGFRGCWRWSPDNEFRLGRSGERRAFAAWRGAAVSARRQGTRMGHRRRCRRPTGAWPDVRRRADLLGLHDLFDAVDGVPTDGPAPRGDRLATAVTEERRLFYVAVTRAARRLVVTAVEDDEHAPSRFLAELVGDGVVERGWPLERTGRPRRSLHLAGLLADLRGAVTDPTRPAADREAAAAGLAKLADAGVRGAHPDQWQGIATPSTDAPAIRPGDQVILSPSQLESILTCPLRAVLSRNGAAAAPSSPQLLGVLVHAIAHGVTHGSGPGGSRRRRRPPARRPGPPPGLGAGQDGPADRCHERGRARPGSRRQGTPGSPRFRGSDRRHVAAGAARDGERGEIRLPDGSDWVSRDVDGRVVVTDFKTSAAAPSRAEVADHPQLAVYQVAIALGAFGPDADPGGGELVMLRSGPRQGYCHRTRSTRPV